MAARDWVAQGDGARSEGEENAAEAPDTGPASQYRRLLAAGVVSQFLAWPALLNCGLAGWMGGRAPTAAASKAVAQRKEPPDNLDPQVTQAHGPQNEVPQKTRISGYTNSGHDDGVRNCAEIRICRPYFSL